MIILSNAMFWLVSFKDATYSYEQGLLNMMKIVMMVSIIALINVIVSLIIGIRKKDCLAIFVTNIMVKTILISLYQILYVFLYWANSFIAILIFIAIVVIEGVIYKKILKYKKYNGMTVSVICNIAAEVIIYILEFGILLV